MKIIELSEEQIKEKSKSSAIQKVKQNFYKKHHLNINHNSFPRTVYKKPLIKILSFQDWANLNFIPIPDKKSGLYWKFVEQYIREINVLEKEVLQSKESKLYRFFENRKDLDSFLEAEFESCQCNHGHYEFNHNPFCYYCGDKCQEFVSKEFKLFVRLDN